MAPKKSAAKELRFVYSKAVLGDRHWMCQTECKPSFGSEPDIFLSSSKRSRGPGSATDGSANQSARATASQRADNRSSARASTDPAEIASLVRRASDHDAGALHRKGLSVDRHR